MSDDFDLYDDADECTVVDVRDEGVTIPDFPTLTMFGPFEILGRIARGGMAEVYLARERAPDSKVRHIVLKRILTEREDDEDFIRMFHVEGDLARRLFHPNVCHVYETGTIDGRTFMTMEWVHGAALRTVIRRAPQAIPMRFVMHIGARIAAALDYVHNAKGVDGKALRIIHRDVSPHNVMVAWDGKIKLLDFGIAKAVDKPETQVGVLKGKHAYLSPEQVRSKPVDARSDLFALGVVIHEMITGEQLYRRDGGVLHTLEAILHQPPPAPSESNPNATDLVDAVVLRALEKEPSSRFASAGQFARALEEVLDTLGPPVRDSEIAEWLKNHFSIEDRAVLPDNSGKISGSFSASDGQSSSSWGQLSPVVIIDESKPIPPPAGFPPIRLSLPPDPVQQAQDRRRFFVHVAFASAAAIAFGVAAFFLFG